MKKLFLVLSFIANATAFATCIHVPDQQPTIQAAIDSAAIGDTVVVADGRYSGIGNSNIRFRGKGILLLSEHDASVTIIDAKQVPFAPGQAFIFDSAEDSTSIVDGFAITGGYFNSEVWPGGAGVRCYQSSPVIRNCIIRGNTAITSHPLGAGGAGVFTFGGAPRIENCTFTANHANYAAAVLSIDSRLEIKNCLFVSNVSDGGGSPIEFTSDHQSTTLQCCDVFGNSPGDWIGQLAGLEDSNGNEAADPLFCDSSRIDLHVRSSSPCVPANSLCGVSIGALGVGCSPLSVGGGQPSAIPSGIALSPNYPNPFNPSTTISFDLPKRETAKLVVYDITGRVVRTLLNKSLAAGTFKVEWDGTNESGQPVASGVYLFTLYTGEFQMSVKGILLK